MLAIAGRDPLEARTADAYPHWRERALGVGRALLQGDVQGVHAQLADAARVRIAVADLARAWVSRTGDAGLPSGEISVVREERAVSGAMVVDLAIGFERRRVRLRTLVLPTGELGGFTFLSDLA